MRRTNLLAITALVLAVSIMLTTICGCLGRKPAQPAEPPQSQQPQPQPGDGASQPPEPDSTTPPAAGSTAISIYLVNWPAQGQPSLQQAKRSVPKAKDAADTAPMKAALEALIAGPTAAEKSKGLSAALPKSTKVLSVRVDGGVATVNFSKEIITKASSEAALSSTGEGLALESIRKTMANFSSLTKVKMLIEGKSSGEVDGRLVEDFWGHVGLPEYLIIKEENRGGTGMQTTGKPADGLAIKGVRWSWDSSRFRLAIDLENTDGTPAIQCPAVRCSISASARVLSIEVNGIRDVRDSRLAPGKPLMISSGPAVSITRDSSEAKGDDQMVPLDLALDTSKSYTYRLFSLSNPVRVVIDVFPE